MAPDRNFKIYRDQISLITAMIAVSRRSAALDAREMRLRAACECATLSLSRDLEAIIEYEMSLSRPIDECGSK